MSEEFFLSYANRFEGVFGTIIEKMKIILRILMFCVYLLILLFTFKIKINLVLL